MYKKYVYRIIVNSKLYVLKYNIVYKLFSR